MMMLRASGATRIAGKPADPGGRAPCALRHPSTRLPCSESNGVKTGCVRDDCHCPAWRLLDASCAKPCSAARVDPDVRAPPASGRRARTPLRATGSQRLRGRTCESSVRWARFKGARENSLRRAPSACWQDGGWERRARASCRSGGERMRSSIRGSIRRSTTAGVQGVSPFREDGRILGTARITRQPVFYAATRIIFRSE
jgi:hypothetical protein